MRYARIPSMPRHALVAALLCVLAILGCSPPRTADDATTDVHAGAAMDRIELYFGLSRVGKPEVTAEQFEAFVTEVVTPRFPDGLTLLDGTGQWRNAHGTIVREHSKVLIVIHARTAETNAFIEAIRAEYKRRFEQESVMRVISPARVGF